MSAQRRLDRVQQLFFFSSRGRHTSSLRDWSSDVCSSDLTGDMGIGKDGKPTERYTPGVELIARETLFAEGCRGSLTKTLIRRFYLRDGHDPQTYAIGLKELWEVAPERHQPGHVVHTVGWLLDGSTYGGSFLYHLENHQVAVGCVI